MSQLNSSSNLKTIDWLRGLAALAVCLYHANGVYWRTSGSLSVWNGGIWKVSVLIPWYEWVATLLFGFGFLGVQLFFVLSGFCIHLPYADGKKEFEWKTFAVRRFFRLYPAYLLTVSICFGLLCFKDPSSVGEFFRDYGWHWIFWYYTSPDPHSAGMGFSPVFWTIAIEVQFYFLYLFFYSWIKKAGVARCAIVGLIIDLAYHGLCYAMNWHFTGYWAFLNPNRLCLTRFGEWLLGAWIAEMYVRDRFPQWIGNTLNAWKTVLAGLFTVALSIVGVSLLSGEQYALDVPAVIGFGILLIGLLKLEQLGVFHTHRIQWIRSVGSWLGDRSYSLYLIHFMILASVVEAGARFLHVKDKNSLGNTPTILGLVLLGLLVTMIATDLFYRLVEAPSHAFGRKLAGRAAPSAKRN